MVTFTQKGWGRIYVAKEEDVTRVCDIIKEIDSFEWIYMHDFLVAPFSEYPILCNVQEFDVDLTLLMAKCWEEGIYVFCLDNGHGMLFTKSESEEVSYF